jgi:hypothetical protein
MVAGVALGQELLYPRLSVNGLAPCRLLFEVLDALGGIRPQVPSLTKGLIIVYTYGSDVYAA